MSQLRMEPSRGHLGLQYDLISSPMMINDLFKKIQLPSIAGSSDNGDYIEPSPRLAAMAALDSKGFTAKVLQKQMQPHR